MAKREERVRLKNGNTAEILHPLSQQAEQMARAGLRYGDPSLPRYATGRVDGKAPPLNASVDYSMRTRSAGNAAGHPSGKLQQPKR